jgi:hypothetical protein
MIKESPMEAKATKQKRKEHAHHRKDPSLGAHSHCYLPHELLGNGPFHHHRLPLTNAKSVWQTDLADHTENAQCQMEMPN